MTRFIVAPSCSCRANLVAARDQRRSYLKADWVSCHGNNFDGGDGGTPLIHGIYTPAIIKFIRELKVANGVKFRTHNM